MAKEQVSSIVRALEILECFMDNTTEWTLKRLVEEGVGIAFLYEAAVERELADGRLARIEFDGPPIEHSIAFVRLVGSAFEPAMERVFAEMAEDAEPGRANIKHL